MNRQKGKKEVVPPDEAYGKIKRVLLRPVENVLFFFLFLVFPIHSTAAPPQEQGLFPSLILCQKDPGALSRVTEKKAVREYIGDGPLLDAQAQSVGRVLGVGGVSKVFLLKPYGRGYRKIWDWKKVKEIQVVSAAAADWELNGNPSLVLAADKFKNRIFLADANGQDVKIRWEYKLDSEPLEVRLCPDTGNFLAVCADSSVREIYFKKNLEIWRVGKGEGLENAVGAARSPQGETFAVDSSGGKIVCFNRGKKTLWKISLPDFSGDGGRSLSISYYEKQGKRRLLASFRSGRKNILFLMDAGSGQVLGRREEPLKPGAILLRAVPDIPAYLEGR